MAEFRIICTTQMPPQLPNDRAHIVAVGTVSSASQSKYWTLSEVLVAMDNGDRFYTLETTSLLSFMRISFIGWRRRRSKVAITLRPSFLIEPRQRQA